jgi:predicted transport protein
MALFKIQNKKVRKILPSKINFEKELQKLFEENLDELLNIIFLTSEYPTSFGGRIDTLGVDKNGAPVIIEYKKLQNENIINQGLSYLRWLLDHKAEFEILCKSKSVNLRIDWNSPRVICIAESFNKFDLDTIAILPIKIELVKYRFYENNILILEPESNQEIKISAKFLRFNKLKSELPKQYSINDHLKSAEKPIRHIFNILREKIISLDRNIIEEPKAKYIAYKLTTNFTDIEVWKKKLKVYLNLKSGQLDDPYNIAEDLTKPKPIGHWGNGDYRVMLEREEDIDKVFELIKRSYNLNK